jgi:anhydro-N-acetylmuramic acid kinase
MSGSSVDGIDLACCEFRLLKRGWDFQILAAETFPYPARLATILNEAIHWPEKKIVALDLELGRYFASVINGFHAKYNLQPELIASHGHTIWHDPSQGITLQVGNGAEMAQLTGIPVVNDFRKEDVAQGGQGAPLVPIGDRLLFGEYGACLNLGGIGNISYEDFSGQRLAFDICPVNMALNWVANQMGQPYDSEGKIGRSGRAIISLVEQLNKLEFYGVPAPRSLGREWFIQQLQPLLGHPSIAGSDLMATLAEHIAFQIGNAIRLSEAERILVTGGGVFNRFLVERIQEHTRALLVVPDRQLVEFKEALIFALLGLLRTRGEINCLSSVTGGRKDLSTGFIHLPKKLIQ